MTITHERIAEQTAYTEAPPEPTAATPAPERDPAFITELIASIALTAFSIAVAAGFARVFSG